MSRGCKSVGRRYALGACHLKKIELVSSVTLCDLVVFTSIKNERCAANWTSQARHHVTSVDQRQGDQTSGKAVI